MRFALANIIAATVLFIGAGAGAVGSWGLPLSAVLLLFGAVVAAVAMEERDLGAAEGLLSHGAANVDGPTGLVEPVLEAA